MSKHVIQIFLTSSNRIECPINCVFVLEIQSPQLTYLWEKKAFIVDPLSLRIHCSDVSYGRISNFIPKVIMDIINNPCWNLRQLLLVRGDPGQGLYSLSGITSYRKISWSLEAARFGFKHFQSFWNLTGTSAAVLPRCLSNFRAILSL